jgi:hypothetical protein
LEDAGWLSELDPTTLTDDGSRINWSALWDATQLF